MRSSVTGLKKSLGQNGQGFGLSHGQCVMEADCIWQPQATSISDMVPNGPAAFTGSVLGLSAFGLHHLQGQYDHFTKQRREVL